jgi:hypothetical protein
MGGSPVLGDHNTGVESGIDNTSSNLSTIPITILTTIKYYTQVKYIFI